MREHFFTPRLRFKTFDELNAWLIDKCIAYAKAHADPERADRTVWEVFAEPPAHSLSRTLRQIPRAAGFCVEDVPGPLRQEQILGERRAVGRPVEIHAYADRIVIRQDGRVVAEHARCFGRGETIYDPWHYVPVLARKPGALRNGAPFKDWVLPGALDRVRRKLAGSDDGDRQMLAILAAVLTDGLPALDTACAEALENGVHSADVICSADNSGAGAEPQIWGTVLMMISQTRGFALARSAPCLAELARCNSRRSNA